MATKSAKANKSHLDKNLDLIQKTAKKVNKEVLKTTEEVLDNVAANGKELRALAKKTVKEANKKIDFETSVEMIRKTTNSVNRQIWKTTEEVLEDVAASGKEMVMKVTENAKETIEEIDMSEQLDTVKKTAKKVNQVALETAEEMVEGAFASSEKWQKLTAKAVKGGMRLAGRQQEIVFDTLETMKGQFAESAERFRKLFGTN